jgi:predicted AlkP superfamily pyrophosphatase or phosphodiesterase
LTRARAIAAGLAGALAAGAARAEAPRTVVVLLFDGFPPAAVERWSTPALHRMEREGVKSELEPPFPSISLPSQTTISTGCWPSHHGVVSNEFLDPQRGAYDHQPDADWLTGCEHLQQAATRQGVTTAALGWVGARSTTRGPQARIVDPDRPRCADKPSDKDDPWRGDEVGRLLLQQPDVRPRLILAYFCGPDDALHFRGPDSDEARRTVEQSDTIVERVLQTIGRLADRDRITLIVTTDHGMTDVQSVVNVRRILGRGGIAARVASSGTTSFVYLDDPARADEAQRALASYGEFDVLRKSALPEWAHLGDGPRVGDLILSAHPPYFIEDLKRWPSWLQWLGDWGPDFIPARFSLVASHGYPPDVPGMRGIFYAWGSDIARGHKVEKVRAVDVHPTVAHLLGIEPGRPVDGQVERALLAEESTP